MWNVRDGEAIRISKQLDDRASSYSAGKGEMVGRGGAEGELV